MSAERGIARAAGGCAGTASPDEWGVSRDDLDAEYAFFKALVEHGDGPAAFAPGSYPTRGASARSSAPGAFALETVQATAGASDAATALVTLKGPGGSRSDMASGNGPIHAVYRAIDRITNSRGALVSYSARSMARGKGAVAGVFIRVEVDGRSYTAAAADTDIICASARAYVEAINASLSHDASRVEALEFEALTDHGASGETRREADGGADDYVEAHVADWI